MATQYEPMYSALPRLFWMMLGPVFLFLIAIQIADGGERWFTGADIVFGLVLIGVVLARWFDFRTGNARTAYGQTATREDLRRFVVAAIPSGLALWVAAKLIALYSSEVAD
ncbi:MAG: hypothetical protein AB7O26_05130 [Planctomycetaceae bacterium]